ncbi:MAG: UDP-N-acetylglucosamine--N-acetylmuramyl-(pentapeptide) pyrophosphoryl-undecaprenol N-acetylglucosamine transferase [Planctomycetes bacterium]|jgi:UDP-N-acetylglucosamine--N-acetylmuramyl-(pentapeptide) pyrophosphoryl-undecaprenol N-acetylglucosamine transferase|nr:UDP-N-acetylglucosamine--N-acetylmuramyl-(pentapeptide) pyrophosphoryl-undecaprenol N-acetylglucosamine transferase [Planctomycetota bacterium]
MADTYIFAGGGTGGHLYPGLAVAEELLKLRPDANMVFACSARSIDQRILGGLPYAVVPQPILPLPRSLRGWRGFLAAYVHSQRLARRLILDLKPKSVLGLGGFAAAAVVKQAARRGIPTGLLNPDAVPGKANRFLSRRTDVIFTQFESTAECFAPRIRGRVKAVGCPIRSSLLAGDRDCALRDLGLRNDRRTLLVNGGSLGAESINTALADLVELLGARGGDWQVLHISGPQKALHDDVWRGRAIHVVQMEYCARMDQAYACADLAVGRGGASSIAELSAMGVPSIILPYPHHADRQQYLNAQALERSGGAIVVEDAACGAAKELAKVLPGLLDNPDRLAQMRKSAIACAKPFAARAVAEWMA